VSVTHYNWNETGLPLRVTFHPYTMLHTAHQFDNVSILRDLKPDPESNGDSLHYRVWNRNIRRVRYTPCATGWLATLLEGWMHARKLAELNTGWTCKIMRFYLKLNPWGSNYSVKRENGPRRRKNALAELQHPTPSQMRDSWLHCITVSYNAIDGRCTIGSFVSSNLWLNLCEQN
jgi:hypothetical protein